MLFADPALAVESLAGESVSGWDNVAVVHELNERLYSLSLRSLSLGHSLGNGEGSLLDTHDQSVTVRSGLSALIENLHDDSLLSSLTSLREHNNSTSFDATEEILREKNRNYHTIYP